MKNIILWGSTNSSTSKFISSNSPNPISSNSPIPNSISNSPNPISKFIISPIPNSISNSSFSAISKSIYIS